MMRTAYRYHISKDCRLSTPDWIASVLCRAQFRLVYGRPPWPCRSTRMDSSKTSPRQRLRVASHIYRRSHHNTPRFLRPLQSARLVSQSLTWRAHVRTLPPVALRLGSARNYGLCLRTPLSGPFSVTVSTPHAVSQQHINISKASVFIGTHRPRRPHRQISNPLMQRFWFSSDSRLIYGNHTGILEAVSTASTADIKQKMHMYLLSREECGFATDTGLTTTPAPLRTRRKLCGVVELVYTTLDSVQAFHFRWRNIIIPKPNLNCVAPRHSHRLLAGIARFQHSSIAHRRRWGPAAWLNAS
ncbi:hypothetical protein FN846DRAFT_690588 [Sphaerosporella brunnea]|uniref:Uncharacterized protein n=1 Tax=Sphaerosporella brunnea TaxID=1250544 RepID=A0A5J5EZH0_9PEZI|nr:hypothetical protein FN846DRAFT_690588 [Sphaerosporella brunnea]